MDYLDSLPGASLYRAAMETREALGLTNVEAVQSTMIRHSEALDRLRRL